MEQLLPLVLIFVIVYFVMIRPQQRRQAQVQSMLSALAIDDDVITIGGIYGNVVDLDDDSVDLRVSVNGPVMRFQRGAIAKILPVIDSADSAESADEAGEIVDDVVEVDVDASDQQS